MDLKKTSGAPTRITGLRLELEPVTYKYGSGSELPLCYPTVKRTIVNFQVRGRKRGIVKTDEIMKPPEIPFISSSKRRRIQKPMPVSKTCHQYGSTQLLHISIPS
jgi:hypothetical protein